MTTVYLDTSVAMNESFLKSPFAEAFLKACAILQYAVVIPEIVIDELKGNYPKKLQEASASFQKAKKEVIKLVDLPIPDIDLLEAKNFFEEWLEEFLDEHGVVVAPYPDVAAKELVEQSYALKKPFKGSGEGHKDYVIWKTILGHISGDETTPPNIFLTSNTKDFCETSGEGAPSLHPDLAGQIGSLANTPTVYTSMKGAFESELAPHLEGITSDDIPNLGDHNIDAMAGKFLLDDLPNRSLFGLEGVPFGNEISISSVGNHSIDSVALKKVDNEVIVSVTGNVELEVDGFIDKFNFYSIEDETNNIHVMDGNWNDHVMWVTSSVETPFELTIFYSTKSSEVTGHEISLPEEIEDDWPYK